MKTKYTLIQNKRRETLEVFEIHIICKEDFKPTMLEVGSILESENLFTEAINIIKRLVGGKIRVINMSENYFLTIDLGNVLEFEKVNLKAKIKESQISIKKGSVVELKNGVIGKIIKNMSNLDITLQTEDGEKIVFEKEQILKVID